MQRLPKQSPNLNAYAERGIQSIHHECLDHIVVLGERHLNYLVREFVACYHSERFHQAVGNLPPAIERPDACGSIEDIPRQSPPGQNGAGCAIPSGPEAAQRCCW